MLKKLSSAALGLLLALSCAQPSWAETVMEKVSRTGILTVGTRFDLIPYAYTDDKGNLVGYSIDALNVLRKQLETHLGKAITMEMVETNNPGDSILKLQKGDIDIACNTAFTWERDKYVDFSNSYSISGIRLVTKPNSNLGTPESLAGKRIGIGENTIAADVIKLLQPKAILVSNIESVEQGFTLLNEGKVDALAGDTIIMEGTVQPLGASNYKLTPEEPYARFGMACMVPENNSAFLNLVNYSLVKLMQGYVNQEKPYVDMVNRWFGADGVVPLPEKLVRSFFETIIIERAQIPPDSPSPQTSVNP
jgi:polar amino acid transport system substrate-binding protein